MLYIRHYAIDPKLATDNVRVEYTYAVYDAIAKEDIGRGGIATLTDGTGALADDKWGDDELCIALAAYLFIDNALVVMASAE